MAAVYYRAFCYYRKGQLAVAMDDLRRLCALDISTDLLDRATLVCVVAD